ncbi:MAG TPA: peptide ABC transporter substrate-binding protein, partial [Myxococcaceae bacterium]|nr:peptide ABC transporter substrate-binding protein [Myxococcaceae bacterium]
MTARALPWLMCLAAASVQAASRVPYGGTLRVALAGELPPADPLLADAPGDVALASLGSRGVCGLDARQHLVPIIGQEIVRRSSQEIRILVRPGLKTTARTEVSALHIAQSWMRLSAAEARSPYRALLFPLRGEGRFLAAESAHALTLPLA